MNEGGRDKKEGLTAWEVGGLKECGCLEGTLVGGRVYLISGNSKLKLIIISCCRQLSFSTMPRIGATKR